MSNKTKPLLIKLTYYKFYFDTLQNRESEKSVLIQQKHYF